MMRGVRVWFSGLTRASWGACGTTGGKNTAPTWAIRPADLSPASEGPSEPESRHGGKAFVPREAEALWPELLEDQRATCDL